MPTYDPLKHHRKSIRLKGYDYTKEGCYFITLNVRDRIHLFGKIFDAKMHPNTFGNIVLAEWEKTPIIRKNITLGSYILMPDHFHAIVQIDYQIPSASKSISAFQSPSQTLGAIVRGFKGTVTKQVKSIIRKEREKRGTTKTEGIGQGKDDVRAKDIDKDLDGDLDRFGRANCNSPQRPSQQPPIDLSKIDLSKSIWQRDYYDRIIRNEREYHNTSNYILNNPLKWEEKRRKEDR